MIKVCSKSVAQALVLSGYKVISSLDPGDKAKLNCPEEDILRLGYDDLDEENVYSVGMEGFRTINDDDCVKLWNFLRPFPDKLLVQCYAGISRSVSTAMAICDCLGIDKDEVEYLVRPDRTYGWDSSGKPVGDPVITKLPNFIPNKLVYNKICENYAKENKRRRH